MRVGTVLISCLNHGNEEIKLCNISIAAQKRTTAKKKIACGAFW
jgi:hypothetical protein